MTDDSSGVPRPPEYSTSVLVRLVDWPSAFARRCSALASLSSTTPKSYALFGLGTEDSNPDLLIQSQLSYH